MGAGSTVTCTDMANCDVKCDGACSVTCAGTAHCSVDCGGSATTPCAGGRVACGAC
jgi:hypothetical protein